jgi:two-component system OmpR family sensor kinase
VDALLALERAAATAPSDSPVALDELIRDLTAGRERVVADALPSAEILGDEEALRRAIGNLIENGLVHGPPGATVHVKLQVNGQWARVEVSDAGSGPDPAVRERLFERFWRAPEAADRPGSGLGLSIVAAIVERHRGRVEVEGSKFTAELPLSPRGR